MLKFNLLASRLIMIKSNILKNFILFSLFLLSCSTSDNNIISQAHKITTNINDKNNDVVNESDLDKPVVVVVIEDKKDHDEKTHKTGK